jgi:glucokinase
MNAEGVHTRGPLLLAGDIGGTKTDLAVYSIEHGPRDPMISGRLSSNDYTSLEELANAFLAEHNLSVDYACFDVAGPVINGHAKLTNLPWEVDERSLEVALNLKRAWLINDLLAVANAVPYLIADDLYTLNTGTFVSGGTIGVIAPGTGLGEAFLTWDGTHYRAYPSEGGHANFAPANQTEIELLQYLIKEFGHVSYERVCAGVGFPNLYRFFRDQGRMPESPDVAEKLADMPENEWARIIIQAGLATENPDPICQAVLQTFVSILGTEVSNLMLKMLSTGGVYIAGGIAQNIIPLLTNGAFMDSVTHKGRFGELVAKIPVHIITHPQVALIGVAGFGFDVLRATAPLRSQSS